MTPEQRKARARIALLARHRPNDPSLVDERRDFWAGRLEDYVKRVVGDAPPLTVEQRARISNALVSAAGDDA